ncbi:transcriptional regulator [Liquorilactobacillus aquaticus DSM 21051]|uniref:Transcriptional regulator n=1 Tax=Liquorilactobacillus aquaticus DSM 21051 TaxID=1423725 RepID=A0A0R2CZW7_9LACO|nr:Rrf2 family transcriptional regulator [Liquorilactobacillus aquaticus]KRM97280.1 transcriptional regulator [Liquorilactobacillus aquaticus DSM 21051]
MKYSHKLSDAIHILAYLEICKGSDLSSTAIAASVESNPSLVRRLMMRLGQAGLIRTRKGAAAPRLVRSAEKISLFDIYIAVTDKRDLLHVDEETNVHCVVGGNIQDVLTAEYQKIQKAAEKQMSQISLSDVINAILEKQQR